MIGFNEMVTGAGDLGGLDPLTGRLQHLNIPIHSDQQPLITDAGQKLQCMPGVAQCAVHYRHSRAGVHRFEDLFDKDRLMHQPPVRHRPEHLLRV